MYWLDLQKQKKLVQPQREIFFFWRQPCNSLEENIPTQSCKGLQCPTIHIVHANIFGKTLYNASISFSLKIVMCEEQPGHD